jgi:hypothetical protein
MSRNAKSAARRPSNVVGYTTDGVAVLKPKVKPTNVTIGEMREVFRRLRATAEIASETVAAGRLSPRK